MYVLNYYESKESIPDGDLNCKVKINKKYEI